MEFITPTMHELSETIRAVKHAQKVIDTVEKKGVYVERVGNTGIKLEITKSIARCPPLSLLPLRLL